MALNHHLTSAHCVHSHSTFSSSITILETIPANILHPPHTSEDFILTSASHGLTLSSVLIPSQPFQSSSTKDSSAESSHFDIAIAEFTLSCSC
jgi:hypothetical protein